MPTIFPCSPRRERQIKSKLIATIPWENYNMYAEHWPSRLTWLRKTRLIIRFSTGHRIRYYLARNIPALFSDKLQFGSTSEISWLPFLLCAAIWFWGPASEGCLHHSIIFFDKSLLWQQDYTGRSRFRRTWSPTYDGFLIWYTNMATAEVSKGMYFTTRTILSAMGIIGLHRVLASKNV